MGVTTGGAGRVALLLALATGLGMPAAWPAEVVGKLGRERLLEIVHSVRCRKEAGVEVCEPKESAQHRHEAVMTLIRMEHLAGRRLDLRGAQLQRVLLSGAQLGGADLREARLEGARLNRTRLVGADLRGARLERASLVGAEMSLADLRDARFEGARLDRAKLRTARLAGATFAGASLREVSFQGADLRGADLRGASIGATELLRACFDRTTRLPDGIRAPDPECARPREPEPQPGRSEAPRSPFAP